MAFTTRQRAVRLAAGVAISALIAGTFLATPAFADPPYSAVLNLEKAVDRAAPQPGQVFTYTISVECSSDNCPDAQVTDVLPPEFDELTLNPAVVITGAPASYAWSGPGGRTLTVDFTRGLDSDGDGTPDPGVVGLASGDGPSIQVSLTVPSSLAPDWAWNDVAVPNTAVVTAATAASVSDSVDVAVHVPFNVATSCTATWTPGSAQYNVGEASTLVLTTRNTSNARAESLQLQVPTDVAAADNLFDSVTFGGFGALVFPAGADLVTIDAFANGSWHPGIPSLSATLPGGAIASEVTGLRVTFTSSAGTNLAANGSTGSVALVLLQRTSTRIAADPLVTGRIVTAQVSGSVSVPGHGTASGSSSASYAIGPLTSAVTGSTSFAAPAVIAAGTGTRVVAAGENVSNGPLDSLTVAQWQTGILADSHFDFAGFRSGGLWPSGATGATIDWLVDFGPVPSSVNVSGLADFPTTSPPLFGAQRIVGFSVTYSGAIAVGADASVPFWVDVAPDAVAAVGSSQDFNNEVRIDGVNDAGAASQAVRTATLRVRYPQLNVALIKSVTPDAPVPAGGRSIVQIRASTSADDGYVSPTSIEITDVREAAPADDYWQAFDVVAIAPTQVPAGATLTITTTADGVTWTPFGSSIVAGGVGLLYQSALPAGVVGVRFAFVKSDGFAQGMTVQGNLSFVARATLRDSGLAPASPGTPVAYTNFATVNVVGEVEVPGGGPVTASSSQGAEGGVKDLPAGSGGLMFDKNWQAVSSSVTVSSQSRQSRTSRLLWGTEIGGHDDAVVQDPADPSAPVSTTVFQAFNLNSISPINAGTGDPYMAYDQVSDVELYNGTSWVSVFASACPTATSCLGAFPGYSLSTDERKTTVGVRLTFEEWAGGRVSDPLAPPIGSGIASGPDERRIDLVFELRNRVRDAAAMADPSNPWITAGRVYHNGFAGSVLNTAALEMGGFDASGSDAMQLLDTPPAVSISKTSNNGVGTAIPIPIAGDVAASAYPTARFTLTAANTSAARAWSLRVTDQMPCTTLAACVHPTVGSTSGSTINPYEGLDWVPATSPFNRFTLTGISHSNLSGTGIDAAASKVTLWLADGSTTTVDLDDPRLQTASFLVDVVGVSALYTGADLDDGGTIVSGANVSLYLDTKLRTSLRSNPGSPVPAGTVVNSVFAQVWDGVLDDSVVSAYGSQSVTLTLTNAVLGVTATKGFSVTSLLERDRGDDVTVTLGANSGAATAAPSEVSIVDSHADFWNAFEFRSFKPLSFPAGANRVKVDAFVAGVWVPGTAGSSPALPAGVGASQVTGLRFTFTDAAGALFSATAPAQSWTLSAPFTVRLRSAFLDSGLPIPFPGTVANETTASSTNPTWGSTSATATASIALATGTFRVDISKTPSVATSPAGEFVDWTLVMRNSGTGYLDNPVVVDQLPIDAGLLAGGPLVYDPTSELSFSTNAGGILPTTGQTIAYDDASRRLTISWPAGSRLAPGDSYTIVIPLQLAPGLQQSYGPAVNEFVFSSDRTLANCSLAIANGESVHRSGTSCTTQNRVSTVAASAISSFKGVKGDVDEFGNTTRGAANVNNPAIPCASDAHGFYRSPCAADSVIGGEDLWKLRFTNGGNVPATSATVVDALPKPGDVYLLSGLGRGTVFTPEFAGQVTLTTDALSAGTTMTWQVTTTANPCPNFASDSACTAAVWSDGPGFSSAAYPLVTGIRILFDFSTLAGGVLPPAADLTVTYRTVNAPSTTSGDHRAPVTVPVTNARAWNSFGIWATFASGFADRRVEPIRAGVQLASGPLQVQKAITGTSAAYAPTSFSATVSCTVAGAEVELPDAGAITLAATNGVPYTARIDGIPLDSVCGIVESPSGATSVGYAPAAGSGTRAELVVGESVAGAAPVPLPQRATITNEYGETSLRITKDVATSATTGAFGPFDFTLSCSVDTGSTTVTVPLAPGDAAFTLADGEEKLVTGLPVTAECQLTEVDSDEADLIEVTSTSTSLVTEGQSATIALGTDPEYAAEVVNRYRGGTLSVAKHLAGDGAGYGAGSVFSFTAVCTYHGQTLLDEDFTLLDGGQHDFTPVMPQDTSCLVTETDARGATIAAAPATVLIPGPTGGQTIGNVVAGMTNTFQTGSVELVKTRTGAGASRYGEGPFIAQLNCTWQRDGDTLTIPLPDGGEVELNAGNGYHATVTGLIAGADCDVTETGTGGATASTVGTLTPSAVPAGGTSTVALTNQFDVGSLTITKSRIGEAAARYGAGPFEVAIECTYPSNGGQVAIDLGAEAIQQLSAANGYEVTIDDLLVGASCTVEETDAGLAITSALTPVDGTVTIPQTGSALVTVTNTFLQGALEIVKTASQPLVEGGTEFEYTFAVSNVGHVDAAGVQVTDDIPSVLAVHAATIDATGWTCAMTGQDLDGYGGTLACDLDTVLLVGDDAPTITIDVTVLPTISQDEVDNLAEVTSTTPQVDGDDDDERVEVKWLDVDLQTVCLLDAPWLDYEVDAHNLDTDGVTMTIEWLDAADTVVDTESVALSGDGPFAGHLLWPGAAVDADGNGVAWPGWRPALAGETPTWENLLLDTSLPEYGLRAGGQVRVSINPKRTLDIDYPDQTASCADTPGERDADLWLTKDANKSLILPGGTFDYTMRVGNAGLGAVDDVELVDPVPTSLQVLAVTPVVPTDPAAPAWESCEVADRLANGFGGTLTCVLDRPLGFAEQAPDVVLTVKLDAKAPAGTILNTAYATGVEIEPDPLRDLPTFALEDDALVLTPGFLAMTGAAPGLLTASGIGILLLGLGLVLASAMRKRRQPPRVE